MNAYELADAIEDWDSDGQWDTPAANMLRQQADRIAELEKEKENYKYDPDTGEPLIDGYPLYSGLPTPQTKPLSDADLTLILEVLINSYDDTNRCYLEYKAMWEKSPTRKARIDGMKRMVDKHANAIEKIEAIIERHGIK